MERVKRILKACLWAVIAAICPQAAIDHLNQEPTKPAASDG